VQRLLLRSIPFPSFITSHSIIDLLQLGLFIGLNVIFASGRVQYSTDFDRYGYLTISNGGLALLFGARNNLFSVIARSPSARLLTYHRWTGRAAIFYASLHLYGESRDWIKNAETSTVFTNMRIQVGIMAWLSLAIIFITSISIIRRLQFEVFYYAHALFLLFIIGAFIHADHAPEFLLPGLCLWVGDRVVRFTRNFRRIQVTSITQYSGGVTKIKVRGLQTSYPGQIAWIQIRDVSFLNWHPFTVFSTPGGDEATLLIRSLGGYTRRLHELMKEKASLSNTETQTPFQVRICADGPYGVGRTLWELYPIIGIVAGGVGITPGISIISHIIQLAITTREVSEASQRWHIHLLWIIKDEEHMEWCSEELRILSDMTRPSNLGVRFNLAIAVTRSANSQPDRANNHDYIALHEQTQGNRQVHGTLIRGRPDITEWFRDLRSTQDGLRGAVGVCGPRSLINTVRTAAAKAGGGEGNFHLEEEVFEF
jgi:predicted ferric reductase